MFKVFKIALMLAGILLTIFILAAILIPMLIDVNDHKDRISQEIENVTGYQVVIDGDVELSFVPWIGIGLGQTHVNNPPGFDDTPMASLEQLQIRIKFWPLFAGRLEAEKIVLNGLNLDLIKDENGRANWLYAFDDAEKMVQEEIPLNDELPADTDEQTSGFFFLMPDIEGLAISNAGISYDDRQNNTGFSLSDFHLSTSRIALDLPISIEGGFNLKINEPDLGFKNNFSTTMLLDTSSQVLSGQNFDMSFNIQGDILPEDITDGHIVFDVNYNLQENSVQVPAFQFDMLKTELMGHFGVSGMNSIPAVSFNIEGRNITQNMFMVPTASGTKAENQDYSGDNKHSPMDLSFLNDFSLDGELTLYDTLISDVTIDHLYLKISSRNGRMDISPFNARLYQGEQTAEVSLEDLDGVLQITARQTLKDLQTGPLITDITQKKFFSGKADMDLSLVTSGHNPDALIANLAGSSSVQITDGVIKGIDLERMIRDVFAVSAGEINTLTQRQGETEFTSLGADFDINQGIASSQNLLLNSPAIKLQGDMVINLLESSMISHSQVSLDGALKQEIEARHNTRDPRIPLRVHGPLDNLSFGLDNEAVLRSLILRHGDGAARKLLDAITSPDEEPETSEPQSDALEGLLRRIMP
ncbi:AsmA family protein [Desulfonatronovibrio magnus]|uniref:AsmA family protein n=1 Tax=Desulfonatronovibrio magnus TaxID=698827 RepID=UPI0005EAC95D|nr:AsmA family protein [Desulfonatronovibrio magnus]